MKSRFKKGRRWETLLCLFLIVAFVGLTSSCSHPGPKARAQQDLGQSDSAAGDSKTARASSGEAPWWKKPENEWLIATLIIIGVGIAVGAAIMITSGGGGLSVRVQK